MFYVCIFTQELPPRILYPEHFEAQDERDKRARLLKCECYNHDGALWELYTGEEPFEAFYARSTATVIKDETPEACKARLDALALEAAKASKSVLTAPEIDDVPVWFKKGFSSQSDMDLQTGRKK